MCDDRPQSCAGSLIVLVFLYIALPLCCICVCLHGGVAYCAGGFGGAAVTANEPEDGTTFSKPSTQAACCGRDLNPGRGCKYTMLGLAVVMGLYVCRSRLVPRLAGVRMLARTRVSPLPC